MTPLPTSRVTGSLAGVNIIPHGVALAALGANLQNGSVTYEDIMKRARNPHQVAQEIAESRSKIQDLQTLPIRRQQEIDAARQAAALNELKIKQAQYEMSPEERARLVTQQQIEQETKQATLKKLKFDVSDERLKNLSEEDKNKVRTAALQLQKAEEEATPEATALQKRQKLAEVKKAEFGARDPQETAQDELIKKAEFAGVEGYIKRYGGAAPRWNSVSDSFDLETPPEGWAEPKMGVVSPAFNADGSPNPDWVMIDGKAHPKRPATKEENDAREFGRIMTESRVTATEYEPVVNEAGLFVKQGPQQTAYDPTATGSGSWEERAYELGGTRTMQAASEGHRSYWGAKNRWMEARLRATSGAAISNPEYTRIDAFYFPQPGDGPKVVREKQRAREAAEQEMMRTSGAAPDFGMLEVEKAAGIKPKTGTTPPTAGTTPPTAGTTPPTGAGTTPPTGAGTTPPTTGKTPPTAGTTPPTAGTTPVPVPTNEAYTNAPPNTVGVDSTGAKFVKLGPGTAPQGAPVKPAGATVADTSSIPIKPLGTLGTNAPAVKAPVADALAPATVPAGAIAGLIEPGNIDLSNRPEVDMGDGSKGTIYSFSIEDPQGRQVLIPMIVNGKLLSEEAATEHYKRTGEHLGIFKTPEDATRYGEQLHNQEAKRIASKAVVGGVLPPGAGGGVKGKKPFQFESPREIPGIYKPWWDVFSPR
jgi:hypothetical protein